MVFICGCLMHPRVMSCDTWVSSSEKRHSVLWAGPVSLHCWGDRSSLSGAVDLSRDRVGWHTHWEGYTLCGHNLLYVTLILLSVDMEFIKSTQVQMGGRPDWDMTSEDSKKGDGVDFMLRMCVCQLKEATDVTESSSSVLLRADENQRGATESWHH